LRFALRRNEIAAPFGEITRIDKQAFRVRATPFRMGANEGQKLRIGDRRKIQSESADLDRTLLRLGLALAGAELEKGQIAAGRQVRQSRIPDQAFAACRREGLGRGEQSRGPQYRPYPRRHFSPP
jgi:hypothetical protein